MVKIPGLSQSTSEMRTRVALRKSDVYDRLLKLIRDPLYSTEKYLAKDFRLLENALVLKGVRIDLHCKQCGRESVFQSAKLGKTYNVEIPPSLVGSGREGLPADEGSVVGVTTSFLKDLTLWCSRAEFHQVELILRIHTEFNKPGEDLAPVAYRVVKKIGQFPTFADLERPAIL